MKKSAFVCLISILTLLCVACGSEKNEMERLPRLIEESKEENTIQFNGAECINYICNYADKLYFTLHYDNSVYEMDIEDDESKKIPINIPENYGANVISTDVNGNIYTVFSRKDESGTTDSILLVKINSEYEVEYQKEIIDYTDKNSVPWAIAADKDEYVYIRMGNVVANDLFNVFDKQGNHVGTIGGGKDYWIIDAMGRCADGYVYAVLDTRGGTEVERYIVKLDGEKTKFTIQDVGTVSAESYVCCGIGSGITEDFLIYASNLDCVKGYSYGNETYTDVGEINAEIKSQISGARCIFLDDGRMLLVTRTGKLENEQIVMTSGNTMFYIVM